MSDGSVCQKTIKQLIWTCVYVGRKIFPPFDLFCIKYWAKKNGNKIIKLVPKSVKKYCIDSGDKVTTVEEEQDRVVYEPAYYLKSEDKEYMVKSPEIYIAELTDVMVHGGTGIIMTGKYALTDIVANDIDHRIKYTFDVIRRGRKNAFYVEMDEEIEFVENAINLCGLAAYNYYHLTFEILSRYTYVRNVIKENDVWILLNEDARKYPQYEELIACMLKGVHIRYVSQYKGIRCKKLIYPSMNTWMPINVRKKYDFRISDNCIAESAVKSIRGAVKELRFNYVGRNNKIFVSRQGSQFLRIINEKEVIELFEKAGYNTVYTENLSYKEQVALFSSASCVVGASGAALTNWVYCNQGTVCGCIIPRMYNFCIYSSIAHMVGCKCLYLDAEVAKSNTATSNELYRVDLDECRQYIRELEKMIE